MKREYFKILIEKYLSGEASPAEIRELCEWIKHNDSLDRWIEREMEASENRMDVNINNELFSRIKQTINSREGEQPGERNVRISFKTVFRWVAVICVPVIIGLGLYKLSGKSVTDSLPLTVIADKGERATVYLPDRTVVSVNSASQIRYLNNFGGDERRVELNGEACFEVTPDKNRPFIVQTDVLEIKVLGTTFNVSSYSDQDEVSVVLIKGKVEVTSDNGRCILAPDEKLIYNRTSGKMKVDKVYSKEYVEWTSGELRFDNESLENIAKVLSRVYDVKIMFDAGVSKEQYFSGSIGRGGIISALDILSVSSSLRYEVKDSVIVLYKK